MKKNPSLKVLAALLAMATMLGACSSSDSDEVETDTTTEDTTTEETTTDTEAETTEDTEAE